MILSICIPNYGRLNELARLLDECIRQIKENKLHEYVQICISDDYSEVDPTDMVEEYIRENPEISLLYKRQPHNTGMDRNFLASVLMADGDYAWIVGNDDVPCPNGIFTAVNLLNKYTDSDFIVTPFDSYSESGDLIKTVYPFKNGELTRHFDTHDKTAIDEMLDNMNHNCVFFDFLSNVIFRRSKWVEHGNRFESKIGSIFIQMYMNIQTLIDGADYYYIPEKIINQYCDDVVGPSLKRKYDVYTGLYDVSVYFFDGEQRTKFQDRFVDFFSSRDLFDNGNPEYMATGISRVDTSMSRFIKSQYINKCDWDKIFSGKQIVIYGAGLRGRQILDELNKRNIDLVFFADQSLSKQESGYCGHDVFSMNYLLSKKEEIDYIIVSIDNIDAVYDLDKFFAEANVRDKVLFL